MTRAVLVTVFVVAACVLANESSESSNSKEKEDARASGQSVVASRAADHPLECKKNETSGCQPCGNEKSCHPPSPASAQSCSAECKPACVCINGYVRGPSGQCIQQSDCPK